MTRAALVLVAMLSWASTASAFPLPPPKIPGCTTQVQNDTDRVIVGTPYGPIFMQLFPSAAPGTVVNFNALIAANTYDDVVVHRIDPNFVIQMGGFRFDGTNYEPIEPVPTIANEPCLSNIEGTISMAKLGGQPDSATSEWFISLVDNSSNLDNQNGGFTVFGRLLGRSSRSIARKIAGLRTAETLTDPQDPMSPALLPDLPFLYTEVQPTEFPMFRESPLQNLPLNIDPPAYGCFDTAQAGVVLIEGPQDTGDWEPDTVRNLPYLVVSIGCAGVGGAGAPSIPCSGAGRRVLLMDSETGGFTPDPTAELNFAEAVLACDDIAASEASLAARLADIGTQLDTEFVKFSYTVTMAPEPAAFFSGASALLSLTALAYRSRRSRG